jgi:hypothetical protein
VKRYFKNGEERIWIAPDEIEEIMSSELNKAGLMPDLSNPVVNLEAFVESHLKVHFDSYATLDPTVLGETEFRVGAPPKVSINKDLTGAAFDFDETAPGILGRWRATVAHEASHVIVHKCLFSQNEYSHSLFDDPETAEPEVQHLQRCLKREVMFRNISSDWKEIQANMGMAALLMPRELFLGAFRQELALLGLSKAERGSNIVTTLVDKIAMRFQVSKQATGIRLESLQLLSAPGQIDLIDL